MYSAMAFVWYILVVVDAERSNVHVVIVLDGLAFYHVGVELNRIIVCFMTGVGIWIFVLYRVVSDELQMLQVIVVVGSLFWQWRGLLVYGTAVFDWILGCRYCVEVWLQQNKVPLKNGSSKPPTHPITEFGLEADIYSWTTPAAYPCLTAYRPKIKPQPVQKSCWLLKTRNNTGCCACSWLLKTNNTVKESNWRVQSEFITQTRNYYQTIVK